jgi:hypothetical protein
VLSASANKLSKLKKHAATYASLIMEELDPDGRGYIEVPRNEKFFFPMHQEHTCIHICSCYVQMQIWQLEKLLRRMVMAEGTQDQMDQASTSLAKTMVPSSYRSPMQRRLTKTVDFIHENWKRIWVLALWGIVNIALFIFKFVQYRRRAVFDVMGYCVCIAKGAAETTKLNMALILLPVCRNTLTSLRSTALSNVVPFDDNINFHKVHMIRAISRTAICDNGTIILPASASYPLTPSNDHYVPRLLHWQLQLERVLIRLLT